MNQNDLITLLDKAGPTADDVAATLRAAGVRGKKASPGCCPVARHARATFPELTDAIVGGGWVACYAAAPGMAVPDRVANLDLPAPVREFVRRFDLGDYPDLEERP